MRFLLLPVLLFSFLAGKGQCKTYLLTSKGDTINCTDMQGMKQGKWKLQVAALRGNPGYEEEGAFVNDKREGVWRRFNLMGDVLAVENYKWGNKNGINRYFTIAGLEREESWMATNPAKPYDTINVQDVQDPNKYEQVIVPTNGGSLRHGKWKVYYPLSGQLLRTETYFMGQLRQPGDESINAGSGTAVIAKPATDTTKKDQPKPKEVLQFEKENSGKKKIRIRDGKTGG